MTIIDRVVAASSATASTFYLMASVYAWIRVLFPFPVKSVTDSVILDRAIAWTAMSLLLGLMAVIKLTTVDWEDTGVEVIRIVGCLAVFIAGAMSVRAITVVTFGNKYLTYFVVIPLLVGALTLFIPI